MNPPLLAVSLELRFDLPEVQPEKFQYSGATEVNTTDDCLRLKNTDGVSFPALREEWETILKAYPVSEFKSVSLSYLNEIPLPDLQDFKNYLNLNIELPRALNDRFEFFRSEFRFKYSFGEIKVWLQPDWDDQIDTYCIQLNLESTHTGAVEAGELFNKLQQLHDGLKDVFRQILSEDYLSLLPN